MDSQVLQICPCLNNKTYCYCNDCNISEGFDLQHLKMLYIRCLPVDADISTILIFLLIELSNNINDLILKLFNSIAGKYLLHGYFVHDLDIASKKTLFFANIQYLQKTGFDLDISKSNDRKALFKCRLEFNVVIDDTNWKYWNLQDLLSTSMSKFWTKIWFSVSNSKSSIAHQ